MLGSYKFSLIHVASIALLAFLSGLVAYRFITIKQNAYHFDATQANPAINTHDACLSIGMKLVDENQFEQGLPFIEKALAKEPNNILTLKYAGQVYIFLNQNEKAIELYQRTVSLMPTNPAAYYNIGFAYAKACDIAKAIESLQTAIRLNPHYKAAHSLLAETYLMNGEFQKGWQELAWHFDNKFKPGSMNNIDLKGKKIVCPDVTGLGDTLQFIRYLKEFKSRGATIYFYGNNSKPLVPLLSRCGYIDKIVFDEKDLPKYDIVAPLMALPVLCDSNEKTIPRNIPYLEADPQLVAFWKEKLKHDTNFKVGISWHSEAKYEIEKPVLSRKSILLSYLYQFMKTPGVSFYSLQKFEGTEELKNLPPDVKMHEFGADFDNSHGRFMDTAAVMKNLDLVISVDTSVAHLAGGLDVPVWLMVPYPADWRWMLNRDDTPWYPKMKIFRQPVAGDWQAVAVGMTRDLQKLVAK